VHGNVERIDYGYKKKIADRAVSSVANAKKAKDKLTPILPDVG
jgi:hypothetical protein